MDVSEDVVMEERHSAEMVDELKERLLRAGSTEKALGVFKSILNETLRDIPKAKAAKIVRQLIDALSTVPNSGALQTSLCSATIDWCREEKRTFLRHRVEVRLAILFLDQGKYQPALDTIISLHREVKKLDDKLLLVEILVVESKIHIALNNVPKAKVALTAAKSNANAIHCPVLLQAEIDMISGIVNAKEKDFKTSHSYFYEAFEALNQANEKEKALRALKYMLLTKIMSDLPGDVEQIINSKSVALQYSSESAIQALLQVARAHKSRSLHKFESVVREFQSDLVADPVVNYHIRDLNETLLEQHLLKLIEPFSRVEIAHIAHLINLPIDRIQTKMSEMILDGKLRGTLDQGIGVLIVFDEDDLGDYYADVLGSIENTSQVVDSLYEKSKLLLTA